MGKIIIIFLSTLLVIVVAAIGALPTLLFGMDFIRYLSTFFILIALQMFIGKLWNYTVDSKERTLLAQASSTQAMADAVQYAELACSYCGTKNLCKILITKDGTYKCEACGETNSILLDIQSARVTKPIMPKQELATIFNNLDKKE